MKRFAARFVLLVLIALALGPAAAPAHAETARSYRTPAPVQGDPVVCQGDVACLPDLEGAPSSAPPQRSMRYRIVRSSGIPAEEGYVPPAPVAIIADVDIEDPRRDRRPHPPLRRDDD
jgi:hypothetical protein